MNTQGPLDFTSTGESVLAYLHEKYPLDLWIITRTNQQDLIVLQTKGDGYSVKPGMVFNWEDSLCIRMMSEQAPNIAPNIDEVAIYQQAPIAQSFQIKACISMPIYAEGNFFGTICGVNSSQIADSTQEDLALIEAQAKKLSEALEADFNVIKQLRIDEHAAANTQLDDLTQLPNWRAWDQLIDAESTRCLLYGNRADVISIDLAGLKKTNELAGRAAGDKSLQDTANILKQMTRPQDILARVGNDEFGVISIDHPTNNAGTLAEHIKEALLKHPIECYIGYATSNPQKSLRAAWELAEHMMYKEKKLSKLTN